MKGVGENLFENICVFDSAIKQQDRTQHAEMNEANVHISRFLGKQKCEIYIIL